ncbi:hypothetical protein [Labilithrix luteola]|nr:hypothetical protein [Labilithrix luteola]
MSVLGCSGHEIPPSPKEQRVPENDVVIDSAAPCVTGRPVETSFCGLPLEGDFENTNDLEVVAQASTTSASCTQLYVATRTINDRVPRVRRYKMISVEPCAFARDEDFAEVTGEISAISTSPDGVVFGLGYDRVRRLAPAPAIDCALDAVEITMHSALTLAPDGRSGWVLVDTTGKPKAAPLAFTGDACHVGPPSEHGFKSKVSGLVMDDRNQLHVLPLTDGKSPLAKPYILDPRTGVIREYEVADRVGGFYSLFDLAPCNEGTCVFDGTRMLNFTSDGHFLGAVPEPRGDGWFAPRAYVGSWTGPLFQLGTGSGSHPGLRLQFIKVPGGT